MSGTSVVIDTGHNQSLRNGFYLTQTLFSRNTGECRRNTWEMNVAPLLRPCAEHHVADKAPTAYRRWVVRTQVLKTGFVTLLKNSVPPPLLASLRWQRFLFCTSQKISTMCCWTLPLKQHPEQLPREDNCHTGLCKQGKDSSIVPTQQKHKIKLKVWQWKVNATPTES